MNDPATVQLVAAGVYLLPALVWAIHAHICWTALLSLKPPGQLYRVLPFVGTLVSLHYLAASLFALTPQAPARLHACFSVLSNLTMVGIGPVVMHQVRLTARPDSDPGRAWLAANYGPAVVLATVVLFFPAAVGERSRVGLVAVAYFVAMAALIGTLAVRRIARRRPWGRATLVTDIVFPDLLIGAVFLLVCVATVGRYVSTADPFSDLWLHLLHAGIGLVGAAFYVLRGPEQNLRRLALGLTAVATAAAFYFGVPALAARLGNADLRRLLHLAAVVALVLALVPGQAWLGAAMDRVLLRHSRRAREELRAFLLTLSPELGVPECCRQALAALVGVTQLRGAGILLAAAGGPLVHGTLRLEPIEQVWPRGSGALPARAFWSWWLAEGPLKRALVEADVFLVVPVTSPHGRWGHLFLTVGFFGMDTSEASKETVEAFADQLALVLDGADLLARAVAVERSLAHAEKLAAIGETAARVVHEIRNPVTAARSLAQQLAREPASPFAAEHGVILAELERVERQVAALLRFARREELRLELIDVGELVRATVESLRARLDPGGVGVEVEGERGVVVRADQEKLRQVLINLIENAIDALGEVRERRIAIAVSGANGTATLRMSDSGPGVPAEALPRLFEPFFSLKEQGTGLGLAIVKRTVEAHGGRIAATSPPGAGMTFDIELPLAEREAGSLSR